MKFSMKIYFLIILIMCLTRENQCYKILLGIPIASRSLHNLFSSIGYELASAGHNVTLFTSFKPAQKHENLIHFQPEDFSAILSKKPDNFMLNSSVFVLYEWIGKVSDTIMRNIWTNSEVWDLYTRRNEFDAILSPSHANEAFIPFLEEYNGVYIMVCTPGVEYNTIYRSGHFLPPSVVPATVLPYDEYMTFWERSNNLFYLAFINSLLEKMTSNFFKKMIREYHPTFDGDIMDYYARSSLTLINGHFALDGPVPLLPNQVEIGTINAQKPKPLPKDLEEFIQGSGDAGIIYFSLGSFLLSSDIPRYIKEILVEAFGKVPQRVIWKYEDDDLKLPPNVLTRKWLPQQDILGHNKTKIFMSHCGNLGTQEAKFHGVPVLAVPVAFDQPRNAARLVRKGYATLVSWKDITVEKLLEAIETLTKDTTYYDRMKSVSRILQDQKDTPAERAVWWVEYVIRHKGAPHLEYAGKRLHLLQYIMLDVLLFWGIVISLFMLCIFWSCRKVWRKCCGHKKTKKD